MHATQRIKIPAHVLFLFVSNLYVLCIVYPIFILNLLRFKMSNERTLINLRGYCLFCLKKIECDGDSLGFSPSCSTPSTPVPPSPLSTPLRTRCHNVHNLPVDERIPPFSDLCEYLGVEDVPDCYAFGDGVDPEVLYPPLCDKCHDLTARLSVLHEELTYIRTRISTTVERIQRRVASTCDKRGAIQRQGFNKEFQRKSKGSLSRGRDVNPETKKVNDLLKTFQLKIIKKVHENQEHKKRHATELFPPDRISLGPPRYEVLVPDKEEPKEVLVTVVENEDAYEKENNDAPPEKEGQDVSPIPRNEFLPLEETLRDKRHSIRNTSPKTSQAQVETISMKPYPDISTILCSSQQPATCSDEFSTVTSPDSDTWFEEDNEKSTFLVASNGGRWEEGDNTNTKRLKFDWEAQRKYPEKRYQLRERPRKVLKF